MENIRVKIEQLRNLIELHNVNYFVNDNPTISDEEYDQLLSSLKDLEEKYPHYKDQNSPTQTIGAYSSTNTFEVVKHKHKMLSLSKVHSQVEFNNWLDKKVKEGVLEFFAELKMDGLAMNLEYIAGQLKVGATRGNGLIGDNVTATTYVIPDIPKSINSNISGPLNGHIRGEVYLKKSKLKEINEIRIAEGKKKFENVRNAAAGLLRRKEVTKENSFLSFGAYGLDIEGRDDIKSYSDSMSMLVDLGVPVVASLGSNVLIRVNNIEDAKAQFNEYFNYIQSIRDDLDYEIDGIVIKANKISDQEKLGSKSNSPEWATSYKFPAQNKVTKLLAIEWTMGNKGNITPNARIEPVEIGGTTVRNVTLHNLEELKRLDLMIGDTIVVSRRGDVIPKVERVVKELRTGQETKIVIPQECPSCSSPTIEKGAYLRCSSGTKCDYMKFAKIQNFVQSLEIDGFGPKIIEKILEHGFANDLADIFDLKVEQLSTIERMGIRSATKLVNNIQAAKNTSYDKILMGLTIPNVGSETAKLIVDEVGSLQGFIDLHLLENMGVASLSSLPGIGDIVSANIMIWVNEEENRNLISKLIERNVGKAPEVKVSSSNRLEGKSFCFTGKLSESRGYYEELVKENGGELSAVKKGLTYLVAGDKAGSKLKKAEQFGIEVIDEETFMEMIK